MSSPNPSAHFAQASLDLFVANGGTVVIEIVIAFVNYASNNGSYVKLGGIEERITTRGFTKDRRLVTQQTSIAQILRRIATVVDKVSRPNSSFIMHVLRDIKKYTGNSNVAPPQFVIMYELTFRDCEGRKAEIPLRADIVNTTPTGDYVTRCRFAMSGDEIVTRIASALSHAHKATHMRARM